MDPWYYNRLSNASASFQSGSGAGSSEYHQQLAGHQSGGNVSTNPSSTSQLLLQAAAHNTSLTSSPFNPAGFLTPNPYDFPPLFSHASKSSPYAAVNQHRALASAMASTKTSEAELSSLRENYSPAHHSSLTATGSSYYDHQNSASNPLGWPHQTSAQLPSPFGVLPHESVAAQSTGSSSTKPGTSDYTFNAYQASHNLSHLSQLADFKGSSHYSDGKSLHSYPEEKRGNRSHSPISSSKTPSTSSAGGSFYPSPSAVGGSSPYGTSETNSRGGYISSSKFNTTNHTHQQQSCVVTSASATQSSKDYRLQPSASRPASSSVYQEPHTVREKQSSARGSSFVPPSTKSSQPQQTVQTKAQSKVYPDVTSAADSSRRPGTPQDTNQSSPLSLSVMDSGASHRFAAEHVGDASQMRQLTTNTQTQHSVGCHSQVYQHALNQAAAYRHYVNSGGAAETDFQRSKSSSVDPTYNTASQQNDPECMTAVRRTSPHASHSQPSPQSNLLNSAYSTYNTLMASSSSPSPLQHTDCHQSNTSSYKPSTQANPTAPLDVSITRPQSLQSQSVAYPSVITRTLSTSDQVTKPSIYNNTRPYDRSPETASYSKQCWDSGSERHLSAGEQPLASTQQRKYHSVANSEPAYNTPDMTANVSHQSQVPRAPVSGSERPHSFYDSTTSHQGPLQDLASCRGDPMSIVKNLQNLQQQTCPVQATADDSRTTEKTPSVGTGSTRKRRKSAEKSGPVINTTDYYVNRVPPPAHHNVSPQQQQNGGYFSNYLSPPSSSRPYAGSQNPIHHVSNAFMSNQHQGLYVSPFFAPFPLSGSSTASTPTTSSPQTSATPEFLSSAMHEQSQFSGSSASLAAANTSSQSQDQLAPVEETPKVVVPNIEEELSYLIGPVIMIKSEQERKNTTASGFLASYLKYLQGERETSPPPSNRGVRKTWTKTKVYQPEAPKLDAINRTVTNGGPGLTVVPSTPPPNTTKEKSQIFDPEDDPRYFPLPKTDAQRRSLDTSDSDSDLGTKTSTNVKTQVSKSQDRKPIAAVAPRTSIKQPVKTSPVSNSQPGKRGRKKKSEVQVPRRETSRRKAKEKGSILLNDEDDDFDADLGDSDSDPAWTPVAFKTKPAQSVDSSDEESRKKKSHKKTSKVSGSGPGRKRARNVFSDSENEGTSGDERPKKRGTASGPKGRRRSLTSGNSNSVKSGDDGDEADSLPFKIGEFVIMTADLSEKLPPIWRVDGKTLLQKFEPFEKNGERLYRNISTYSGWSPQNRHIYRSVQVRFRLVNRTETIIEFLKDEMTLNEEDDSSLEQFVNETAKYQDNFEVYIQTLISQALDSNFLTEIFQEQDEYFLSNVKTVDEIVDDRRKRFLQIVNWRLELEASIATWPCYNVIFELVGDEFRKNCAACEKPNVAARVLLYGQPYNSTTLEGCQADPKLVSEKDFLTCRLCLSRIELYNKVAHQKYLMYIECAKRVNERRSADSSKDTTVILNELLADETWLNQLFRNVRTSWAQMDRLEQSAQQK